MSEERTPRDERGPDDDRDVRDERRPGDKRDDPDPRDTRDERRLGDERDERDERALSKARDQRPILGWPRRHPFVSMLAVLIAVIAPGYWRVEKVAENNANEIADALAEKGKDDARHICEAQNDLRAGIVDEAAEERDEQINLDPRIAALFPDLDPAVIEEIARADYQQTKKRFAPIDCS